MQKYLLIFKSLTYAQLASKKLYNNGVYTSVDRAPKSASLNGCAYGVTISENKILKAKEILKGSNLEPTKTFILHDTESLEEVKL